MATLQHMFNQKFLEVARLNPSFMDGGISDAWNKYMECLGGFGVFRGGWLRGLFARGHVRIMDPLTLEQYADWTEFSLLPPHALLDIVGYSRKNVFVPKDFADKALALGALPPGPANQSDPVVQSSCADDAAS